MAIGRWKFVALLSRPVSLAWRPAAHVQKAKMTIRQLLGLSAAALAASTIACAAGPCSHEIEHMQARLNARIEAAARTGPSAPEGSSALLHHQPTPRSMAEVEIGLGKISPEKAKVVRGAMARARNADQASDKVACEQALAEIQRTIGP